MTVERLERDVGALTDEQRLSAVMTDAPELAALLGELQGSLAEVRSHVGPVLREVGAWPVAVFFLMPGVAFCMFEVLYAPNGLTGVTCRPIAQRDGVLAARPFVLHSVPCTALRFACVCRHAHKRCQRPMFMSAGSNNKG